MIPYMCVRSGLPTSGVARKTLNADEVSVKAWMKDCADTPSINRKQN